MPRLQDEINRLFGNARENDGAWSAGTANFTDVLSYPIRWTAKK
jgi:hypothetical protein